jgi:tetratricopeptide (TPR) repeat protein
METIMQDLTKKRGFRLYAGMTVLALLLSTLGLPVAPVYAGQQDIECNEKILRAEQLYIIGRFDEAITILTECFDKGGLTDDQKMRAYRLLGLSYIAKDYLEDARSAIRKLLDMVPEYMPDPVQDPPPFTKLVEEVKEQREEEADQDLAGLIPDSKERKNKMWLIIGGALLIGGGAAAAIMLTGKKDENAVVDITIDLN